MIHEVDASLQAFLEATIAASSTSADISFEPPTAEWRQARKKATVNAFLYDVREDLDGRVADWEDVRNEVGKVIGRRPPRRRYQLSYLLSAWADTAREEHELLGTLLEEAPNQEMIPFEHVKGRLAEQESPVRLHVSLPSPQIPPTWDMWGALGGPPKAFLHFVLSAALPGGAPAEVAEAAAKIDLTLSREPNIDDGQPKMEDYETTNKPAPFTPEEAEAEAEAAAVAAAPAGRSSSGGGGGKAAATPAEEPPAGTRPVPPNPTGRAWRGIRITEKVADPPDKVTEP